MLTLYRDRSEYVLNDPNGPMKRIESWGDGVRDTKSLDYITQKLESRAEDLIMLPDKLTELVDANPGHRTNDEFS